MDLHIKVSRGLRYVQPSRPFQHRDGCNAPLPVKAAYLGVAVATCKALHRADTVRGRVLQLGSLTARRRVVTSTSALAAKKDQFKEAIAVDVQVTGGLQVQVLEASIDWQEALIEEAVEAEEGSLEADPYGAAMWPAAQVLAQAVTAYADEIRTKPDFKVLEIGAGCGLVSLTMLSMGASVLATDARELPLQLLEEAARRQDIGSKLRMQLFDVKDVSKKLPAADLVVASDVLYEASVSMAMAQRIAEARRRGSKVLVADQGRPNAKVFLQELRRLLPEEESIEMSAHGMAVQQSTQAAGAQETTPPLEVQVGVLELPLGPATAALQTAKPCIAVRPESHSRVL